MTTFSTSSARKRRTSNIFVNFVKKKEMKKVQVYCGFKIYDDELKNVIGYEGDYSGEGYIYKDYDAFENHPDEICYLAEGAFDEKGEYADFLTVEEAKNYPGETHNTIVEQVRDAWGEDYMLTDEQVEYFAKDVFGIADWAHISTYLTENFEIDDCIEFDHIKGGGMFTKFQYDAIMDGKTPAEYAERDLSYQEYAEICDEFYQAFVVDEECEDDWSDKGLGTNALITYVDDRKRGYISGPDEFDCDDKWRKCVKQ